MKRLIFILLITPQLLFSQSYKSMFSNGKISSWGMFSNSFPSFTYSHKTYFDTIVNGKSWKYFHASSGAPNILSGFLREDTSLGKVWFKGINVYSFIATDTAEKLVCDFSLNIGDSFHYQINIDLEPNLNTNKWIKVDSIFYINGLKHIRFDTSGFSGLMSKFNLVMIEGVGTNYGFYFLFNPNLSNQYTMQCQYRDSDLFYSDSFVPIPNNCDVTTFYGIDDIFNSYSKSQTVYPNPSNNFISISNFKNGKVEIINSLGQLILTTSQTENINIENLPQGIYWIKYVDGNNILRTSKFIKQ